MLYYQITQYMQLILTDAVSRYVEPFPLMAITNSETQHKARVRMSCCIRLLK